MHYAAALPEASRSANRRAFEERCWRWSRKEASMEAGASITPIRLDEPGVTRIHLASHTHSPFVPYPAPPHHHWSPLRRRRLAIIGTFWPFRQFNALSWSKGFVILPCRVFPMQLSQIRGSLRCASDRFPNLCAFVSLCETLPTPARDSPSARPLDHDWPPTSPDRSPMPAPMAPAPLVPNPAPKPPNPT
jgi:hypothetical protein